MLEIVDMLERIHTFPGMLHVLESRVKCFNPFSFGVFHFRNRWRLVRCYLNYLGRSLSGVLKGLNVPAEKRSDRKYEFVLIAAQECEGVLFSFGASRLDLSTGQQISCPGTRDKNRLCPGIPGRDGTV